MNAQPKLNSLHQLNFDNRYVEELPGDPEQDNFVRQVRGAAYSKVLPAKVANPQLIAYSREMAALLDLSEEVCKSRDFAEVFSGNRLLDGMEPFAMCYGGHQFGVWAGQLGDGRVINLGEVVNAQGERWQLQLKGAGLTPYSRRADGLAVLRSSVREFLCSEAMHHLGVPTTRALSLVSTGETVIRDMFYNGNPQPEPGAIVCRVAPTFIRFGHFQNCTAQGDLDLLKQMADHTLRHYFPHLGEPCLEAYAAWFKEICRKTARLMLEWERVGFVHGVMNTDNMSILGLTIDYGPYGWLENYDPDWTPNTTDAEERRYRFSNQPACAYWNLVQLANALYPLFGEVDPLEEALRAFIEVYEGERPLMLNRKLGLSEYRKDRDDLLHSELLELLQLSGADMALFFRKLLELDLSDELQPNADAYVQTFEHTYYDSERITTEVRQRLLSWLSGYRRRLREERAPAQERRENMRYANPKYVLRNYLAQLAIDEAGQGNYAMIHELLNLLRHPYDEQPGHEKFVTKRPDWARSRVGCSMLSCSS